MTRRSDLLVLLAVVAAVWAAHDGPYLASSEAAIREAKYVLDGAAHFLLCGVVLYLAARSGVSGFPGIVMAASCVYGALHGALQAVCGAQAYWISGAVRTGTEGLCERTTGWEPLALAVAVAVAVLVLGGYIWSRK